MAELNDESVYSCPVCRIGQLQSLPLMDALACNFCQHIFEVNLEKRQLVLPARQPALLWHWNGKNWTGAHLEGVELGWAYRLAAIALVTLPTTVVGLVAYTRPPVPGTPLAWLPVVWTGLVFLSHLGIILWLMSEFYQFPVKAYLRAIRQLLLSRSLVN